MMRATSILNTCFRFTIVFFAGALAHKGAIAENPKSGDIVYGAVDGLSLKLDFYKPKRAFPEKPLVVWIHGGAWRSGSKADVPVLGLREHGFAIASVDYRLSPLARFPAQIHDIKMAIRFLRSNVDRFGVDANRFVLAGASAGGHLAVLSAVSDGVPELSGPLGTHEEVPSRVQAVVSFYGASNLRTILAQSTPFGIKMRVPALELLLGGVPEQQPALAKLASPVEHVDSNDPPLWLFHGDQDPQMPIDQARELEDTYKKHGLPVKFEAIHGAAHGGSEFYMNERLEQLAEDLLATLKNSRE